MERYEHDLKRLPVQVEPSSRCSRRIFRSCHSRRCAHAHSNVYRYVFEDARNVFCGMGCVTSANSFHYGYYSHVQLVALSSYILEVLHV